MRPGDTVFAEVVVNVMAQPTEEGMTAAVLGEAAVEAVLDAVQRAEKQGHRYRLKDRVALCVSQAAELRNLQTMSRSSCIGYEERETPGALPWNRCYALGPGSGRSVTGVKP